MAEVPVPEIDMPGQGLPEGEDIGSMKDKIISRLRNYMAKVGMDVPEPEMAAAPEQQIPPAPMGDQQPIVPGEAGAIAAIDEMGADGAAVIDALSARGLRIYPEGGGAEGAEDPLMAMGEEDALAEEMPEEGMGEEGLTDLEAPPMAAGTRDEDIMSAVGAATKNDAARKKQYQDDMEAPF